MISKKLAQKRLQTDLNYNKSINNKKHKKGIKINRDIRDFILPNKSNKIMLYK